MNLGSPDSTEVYEVRKYLNEFLTDKRVIDSWAVRNLLVRTVIVPARAPKSAEAYRSIWTKKGSPLVQITRELSEKLQDLVTQPVAVAMRYGNPTMESAYESLINKIPDLEEVIAIPLYPHYAMSSFETAVEHAATVHREKKYEFKLTFIPPFYQDPQYIHAMAENMRPYLQKEFDHLLFSFHGIPERHLIKSDLLLSTACNQRIVVPCLLLLSRTCYRHQCLQNHEVICH